MILSAAIINFDIENKNIKYQDLLDSACFVRFNVSEQKQEYKRTIRKSTLEWWDRQSEFAKKKSFYLDKKIEAEVSCLDSINTLKAYIENNGGRDQIFWARGSLDQMAIDSLCVNLNCDPIAEYYMWRDVRTAVDILHETSKRGYCKIDGFNPDLHVIKHDPIHDCALDVMMLVRGI